MHCNIKQYNLTEYNVIFIFKHLIWYNVKNFNLSQTLICIKGKSYGIYFGYFKDNWTSYNRDLQYNGK